ncbi:unnamed protein product, partial [Darwinula stevensoni]
MALIKDEIFWNEREACRNGWSYDRSLYAETVASAFHWVCDEEWRITLAFTLVATATMLGSLVLNNLADWFGRRPIFYGSAALHLIFGTGLLYAKDYGIFSALLFLKSIAFPSCFQIAYIMSKEQQERVSSPTFQEFFEKLLRQVHMISPPDQPVYVIIDHARLHKRASVPDDFPNVRVKFLPAYSPFLNPTEHALSAFKAAVKRLEQTGPEHRMVVNVGMNIVYVFGVCVQVFLAWVTGGHWIYFGLATTLPVAAFYGYFKSVP